MQHSRADKRGGNRSTSGKRKLDTGNSANGAEATQSKTIPDLFSQEKNNLASGTRPRNGALSPSGKRARRGSPGQQQQQQQQQSSSRSNSRSEPIPVEKMYNFSNTDSTMNGGSGYNSFRAGQQPSNNNNIRAGTYNPSQRSNFTPHSGAKKLVVKNLRGAPRLDQNEYFETVWTQLDSALTAIFNDKKPSHSLEELYRSSENVCRQGKAANLAERLRGRCEAHIRQGMLGTLETKAAEAEPVDCLRAVEGAWATWNSRLITIRSIFYYLDQSFLLHSADHPVIYEMGMRQFRNAVFSDEKLKPRILQGACQLVELDRRDDALADQTLLSRAIKLFHDLVIYSNEFEPTFLEASGTYFKNWADERAGVSYISDYVSDCHRLIDREMARCDLFGFNRNTRTRLSEMLDRNLVLDKNDVLLAKDDIIGLLRTNNKVALEQLYTLLQRQEMGDQVKPAFCASIIKDGGDIVFDEERESEMVVRLLQFKQNLDDIWRHSFHKNEVLGGALRESFETFINQNRRTESNWNTDNPKPGEMIAKYVDLLLKGGLKAVQGRSLPTNDGDTAMVDEDTEISKQLDQVLDLFRFVHGKAVFEAFYKNDLARRLLMGRSASDDAEKGMLARLKSECGAGFTHNLESMFKDMDLARDEMASFNAMLREKRERRPMELNVHVLSAASWPSYPDVPVKLPAAIDQAQNEFEEFYNGKYRGRKLAWKHSLAHCQITAHFPKGRKEIVVSSFQGIVMLLFNEVGSQPLSYREIRDATGLSDAELKRTLQSLACAKYRVLNKRPKGKEVNEDDEFVFNAGFSDPKFRIKINQIQLKETRQENKTTHERVAADRHFETQAAIVRIMKSRKTMTHPELVGEVLRATKSRGVLEPDDIKKNIERLMEKEYLERQDDNKYRYLA